MIEASEAEQKLERAAEARMRAGEEAKTAMRAQADRLAAEFDLIRRDDFEALKAEVAALRDEVAALKAKKPAAKKAAPSKKVAAAPPIASNLDYDSLTLAQLRARMNSLSVADLRALLTYEDAGKARAPFQTLLANRITRATAK